jgi:hypothetical protein
MAALTQRMIRLLVVVGRFWTQSVRSFESLLYFEMDVSVGT